MIVTQTRQASEDLLGIWVSIHRKNPAAADMIVSELIEQTDALGDLPELGRPRPELGRGIRSLNIGQYIAFYRLTEDRVEIIRYLYGRRDLRTIE